MDSTLIGIETEGGKENTERCRDRNVAQTIELTLAREMSILALKPNRLMRPLREKTKLEKGEQ